MVLQEGDIIRFGTDIFRGALTFPPCTVRVGVSWNQEQVFQPTSCPATINLTWYSNPQTSDSARLNYTNTFSVPDFDDEEDQISDDDEDDIMETDKPVPTRTTSKLPQATVSIDLTGGAPASQPGPLPYLPSSMTLVRMSSDVIDLTSEIDANDTDIDLEDSAAPSIDPCESEASSPLSYVGDYYDGEEGCYPSSEAPHDGCYGDSDDGSSVEDGGDSDAIPASPVGSDSHRHLRVFGAYSPLYESESDDESFTTEVSMPISAAPVLEANSPMDESLDNESSGGESELLDIFPEDGQPDIPDINSGDFDDMDENGQSLLDVTLTTHPRQINITVSDIGEFPYSTENLSTGHANEEEHNGTDYSDMDELAELYPEEQPSTFQFPTSSPIDPATNEFSTICGRLAPPTFPGARNFGNPFPYTIQTTLYTTMDSVQRPVQRPMQPRAISPSDAMMAKSEPSKTQPCIPASTSEALGQRTGKYEFFAARAKNRAAVLSDPLVTPKPSFRNVNNTTATRFPSIQQMSTGLASSTQKSTTQSILPPWREPALANDAFDVARFGMHTGKRPRSEKAYAGVNILMTDSVANPGPIADHTRPDAASNLSHALAMTDIVLDVRQGQKQAAVESSVWTPLGEEFLKKPLPLSNERTRLQSPELDMTSAASFMESKKKPEIDMGRARRCLPIESLLSNEANETPPDDNSSGRVGSPRPLKRSFEAFSDVEEQAIDSSLCKPTSTSTHPVVLRKSTIDVPVRKPSTTSAMEVDVPVPSEEDESQPIKSNSVTKEVSQAGPVVIVPLANRVEVRPAKRRRFSKLAKYASVGVVSGMTSAALLFAGLAATAPHII